MKQKIKHATSKKKAYGGLVSIKIMVVTREIRDFPVGFHEFMLSFLMFILVRIFRIASYNLQTEPFRSISRFTRDRTHPASYPGRWDFIRQVYLKKRPIKMLCATLFGLDAPIETLHLFFSYSIRYSHLCKQL